MIDFRFFVRTAVPRRYAPRPENPQPNDARSTSTRARLVRPEEVVRPGVVCQLPCTLSVAGPRPRAPYVHRASRRAAWLWLPAPGASRIPIPPHPSVGSTYSCTQLSQLQHSTALSCVCTDCSVRCIRSLRGHFSCSVVHLSMHWYSLRYYDASRRGAALGHARFHDFH